MPTEVLLLDSISRDAVDWLTQRYRVAERPIEQLGIGSEDFKRELASARAMVLPATVKVGGDFLRGAAGLEVFGRLTGGTSNTDLSACQDYGVTVLNSHRASVHSSVEYMLSSLLALHRPAMWRGLKAAALSTSEGDVAASAVNPPGRELYRSVVGIIGLGPLSMALAPVLQALGARLVGYDPAIHASAEIWQKLNIYPLPVAGVLSTADSVCVQMIYATRFQHFINEHVLKHCKRGQVWVSSSRSVLFEADALRAALTDGRIRACLIDSAETQMAGFSDEMLGLPNFFLTPRLGAQTAQAHDKASWYLAHGIDAALQPGSEFLDRPDSEPTMP